MIPLLLLMTAMSALPLAMAIVNLRALRAPAISTDLPSVAILIPARDEEDTIAGCVEAALASRDVLVEVVVLDDGSRDRTAAIVQAMACRDGRLRMEKAPLLPPRWNGKQHACHVLSALTDRSLLVFVDADVRLAPDGVARLCTALSGCDLVSGVPRQIMITWSECLLIPMINMLILNYLPVPIMRRRSDPSLGVGCGQLVAVRADAYRRCGGHAAIRESRHDGLKLPLAFRRAGLRTDLVDATSLAACRMYGDGRALIAGLLKNADEGMARPLALPIWTAILLLGHVVPWVVLAVAIVEKNAQIGAFAAVSCVMPLIARVAQALRFREPLAAIPAHPVAVLVLLAVQWIALARTIVGVPTTWRGRTYPQ